MNRRCEDCALAVDSDVADLADSAALDEQRRALCPPCDGCRFVIESGRPAGPPADLPASLSLPAPSDDECQAYWDRFCMPDHVRGHSQSVATVATALAKSARARGLAVDVQTVRAAALLHDLAKAYTIRHGGNHCQLGGAWVMDLTGNAAMAQAVIHHVTWPFDLDFRKHFLPLVVIYADKRVRHEEIVTFDERFSDLLDRYGKTEDIRRKMMNAREQIVAIENGLQTLLGIDLNEDTFDRGRLV